MVGSGSACAIDGHLAACRPRACTSNSHGGGQIAGAYCLAWTAGFLAITNPGGLGVREFVFTTASGAVLPRVIKDMFPSREILNVLLLSIGILLRLWTIAGELILPASPTYWITKAR